MAKKNNINRTLMFFFSAVGIFASIGIGELFLSGFLLSGPILGVFPLLIHQIVGWTIIVSGFLAVFALFTQ